MLSMLSIIGAADWRGDIGDLIERAGRLWTYADEIYSATQFPFVSRSVLKNAPDFGIILDHIYEAGRASVRAECERELQEANEENARLKQELRDLGGDPDLIPSRQRLQCSHGGEKQAEHPVAAQSLPIPPDAFPWLRDWIDAMSARATLDALCFASLDDVADPPDYWPETLRRPVRRFTGVRLAVATDAVLNDHARPPRGESSEAYLARFTKRIVRLGAHHVYAVATVVSERRWEGAENPVAYIRRAAQLEHLRANGWMDPARSRDVYALGSPASLSRGRTPTGDPLEALLVSRSDELANVETSLDLELAIRGSGLSPREVTFLRARLDGIPRRDAGATLGWTNQEVEAASKALQRARPRLREGLSA